MNKFSKKLLEKVISESQGRFVGITFIKQDGTLRRLNGRLANDKDPLYLTMYDIKKRGYRSVNREKILEVRADGVTIKLQDPLLSKLYGNLPFILRKI